MSLHEGILTGGFQKGVPVMEISNGGNLSATVLPGRCMDLYQVLCVSAVVVSLAFWTLLAV